jgi:hypothetical protein
MYGHGVQQPIHAGAEWLSGVQQGCSTTEGVQERPETLFCTVPCMTTTAEWADTDGPLEAFPANSSGAQVGYARVSTKG